MRASCVILLAILLPAAPPAATRAADETGRAPTVAPGPPTFRASTFNASASAHGKATSPAARQAVISNCQVLFLDDVEVPAQEAGALVAMTVKEGEFVRQGQLLAQIDDRQAQLQREAAVLEKSVAQVKADDDIEVRYAQKSFELAQAELQRDLDINKKSPGSVPESEVHRKQLAQHRAELQIDRSRLDLKVARMTADVHNATVLAIEESIRRRRIEAPFDGMVFDIYREAAEWVNAGEAVLRVVRMDRLRVAGFLDGSQFYGPDVAGRPVTIVIELAGNRVEQFQGEITFVNPMVQAGNQYRVTAEVQNRSVKGVPLLSPGMTATMVIGL